ncbi:glycosyltransferase family 2 protein [Algoriphagus marinus]|uniref:glycosyltransferase family 2 protein n=1 Tax=Algoriphagus marinus TaxID=1925762 RepID=UPI00094BC296|nr:glycosyltransferase family 2 protein [Algoriphagus marinus]
MKELTIIVPIYNEEAGIDILESEFQPYFEKSSMNPQMLLVDDGSTDGSLLKIKKLCETNSRFHFISFDRNRGLSAAILAGFKYAKSDWLGYIDADLQTKPIDFLRFEPFLDSFDLVLGARMGRKDSPVKKITSRFANWFRDSLLNDGVKDSGCPLKIIKREYALALPYFSGVHRFIPALVLMQGGKVKEIPIAHYPRESGKSKFNFLNRSIGPLVDTIGVRWMMKRRINYKIQSSDRMSKDQIL